MTNSKAHGRIERKQLLLAATGLVVVVAFGLPAALVDWNSLFSDAEGRENRSEASGLDVTVRLQTNDRWVVPRPIEAIPAPPPVDIDRDPCNSSERGRWVEQLGGVGASGDQLVEVIVTSALDSDVVIEGFELATIERSAPLEGTNIRFCGGGGPINANLLDLDLDADPPTFRFFPEEGEPTDRFAFVLSPQNGRTEYFFIQASSDDHRVQWSGELVYLVNGERRRSVINDGGKPFALTARPDSPVYGLAADQSTQPWVITER